MASGIRDTTEVHALIEDYGLRIDSQKTGCADTPAHEPEPSIRSVLSGVFATAESLWMFNSANVKAQQAQPGATKS
jgi:hypothetical protein